MYSRITACIALATITATVLAKPPLVSDVSSTGHLREIVHETKGVSVLNVWATWCLPCLSEMEDLRELSMRFDSPDVRFIGLSIDDAAATDGIQQRRRVADLLARKKIEYPNYYWTGDPGPLFRMLRTEGEIPLTVVMADGKEVWRHQGAIVPEDLAEVLARITAGNE